MKLHVVPCGPISTNAYLLLDPTRGEALLIDAPEGVWAEVEPLLKESRCRLAELWITHGHWDHMQGAAEVVRACGALTRAHRADQSLLETPETMAFVMNMEIEPVKIRSWVAAGDRLTVLGTEFEVRHVPGHCPGNILFYAATLGAAWVGDAIFRRSVGRTDLPGGSADELARSIRTQIYTLPDETQLLPGHGPATTVADEKAGNPYVRP